MQFDHMTNGELVSAAMDSAAGESSPEWREFINRMVTLNRYSWLGLTEGEKRDRLMARHSSRETGFTLEDSTL